MHQQNQNGQAPVDQRTQDLINASVDGEISAIEQDELDRLLLSSDGAREFDRDLRSVTSLLDDLPEIEPPAYLHNAIERQVRLPVDGAAQNKPAGWLAWLESSRLRMGLAMAAGVVLTVSVYEMGSRPVSVDDTRTMTGTIVKHGKTGGQGEVLDSIRFGSGPLNGLVELRNADDLFTVDVQLDAGTPVDVVMDYSGSGLDFEGASNVSDSENAISYGDGKIRLASNGKEHFTVKLRRAQDAQSGGPVELGFYAGDRLLEKTELNISRR